MNNRVLLVVAQESTRAAYLRLLNGRGAEIVATDSLLPEATRDAGEYQAVLVDIGSAARASAAERVTLERLSQWLPIARLRYDPRSDRIFYMPRGGRGETPDTLDRFLAEVGQERSPERLRTAPRVSAHLNVTLTPEPASGTGAEVPATESVTFGPLRTITIDVSLGGCFVVTADPWPIGTRASLTAYELDGVPSIPVEVCWKLPWGTRLRAPGMGLRFLDVDDDTLRALVTLLSSIPR